jgi:phytoene dehydrogenase-like protein
VENKYDAIVIGAGMSGLACAIRLAMFDKNVLLVEKHSISGGLNSYYRRRNFDTKDFRLFDVGLHALTNYIEKGEKKKPFSKLLKQLRLKYDDFNLKPQSHSIIRFNNQDLKFDNDFETFKADIKNKFPDHYEEFLKLHEDILAFDELNLSIEYKASKDVLRSFISSEELVEMILCPLLIYGSAWENDMDYAQFVIMYKSIYLEGFSRPVGGVRTILNMLLDKYEALEGKLSFRTDIKKIHHKNGKVFAVETKKDEMLYADKVFSSAGIVETMNLCDIAHDYPIGKMSFMESIIMTDRKIKTDTFDTTIMFYNDSDKYSYEMPNKLYDDSSAVICIPDNYEKDITDGEGTFRITYMANYDMWKNLDKKDYKAKKEQVLNSSIELLKKQIPGFSELDVKFTDVFSPTTIKRYTYHEGGAVYGSEKKNRDGKTDIEGLYIIGTDQGFLGIVGAMLSGISIGNLYGLME